MDPNGIMITLCFVEIHKIIKNWNETNIKRYADSMTVS
jgi:hypothetical protein